MAPSTCSHFNSERSSSERARLCKARQFTAAPSATPSIACASTSSAAMPHLLGQSLQGACDRHPRRIRARLAEHRCELFVAVLELEAADDRFLVRLREAVHRRFVGLDVFGANCELPRRKPAGPKR